MNEQPIAARVAGQHARAMTMRLRNRGLARIGLIAIAGVACGIALGFTSPYMLLVEGVVVAAVLAEDRFAMPVMERWARGARGEEQVGRIIDGLQDDGWLAVHDLSLGRGNVDHVLIGPAGVFTLETKSHRGRIKTTDIDPTMLKQAYAEGKLLERITDQSVQPLLVFSQAYLDRPVSRRQGVVILPARMLAGHLRRRSRVMSDEEVTGLHRRLLAAVAPAVGVRTSAARSNR